jgi:RNA polymerase-binding transcription factor
VDAVVTRGVTLPAMDPDRARELLARERSRIERELATLEQGGALDASDRSEPGGYGSEDLYEDERDEGRREDLNDELAAVSRAEQRLAAGTYGLSIESGEPIPDERLQARPTAERTVEEDERYPREGPRGGGGLDLP